MAKKDDFNAKDALKEIKDDNEGVNFENKVQEAIRRSTDVQKEVKDLVWCLLKEKFIWVIIGAFSFVLFDLLKYLAVRLIDKI